jgi:D-alanyl-D-alanine carboxypeptidase
VFVRSGARSRHEQEILYARFLRDGHPLTAKPGTSRHETGKAADCQIVDPHGNHANIGDNEKARAALRRRGLCLPVAGEKWHVEVGTTWNA